MKRKWLHGIIGMLLLVVLGVCSFKTDSNVALAADSNIDLITDIYEDSEGKYVSKEISTSVTPELVTSGNEDWLFAGWYKAQECTKANAYRTKPTKATAWAKFVPAEVLSVKVQVTKDADKKKAASEKVDMRMVASVDDLNYQNVGFEVSFNGGKFIDCSGNKEVYQRISSSSEANVEYNFSPKVVDTKSEYFITHTLTGIGPNSQDGTFLIRPYWVTLDGTTVYGVNRTVKVSDSYSDVVSLSVKANTDTLNLFTATVGDTDCTISERRYADGEKFADLIVSTDKDALPSATKYEISDGTSVIYRNHYTTYKGADTEDISWYEVNKAAEEFVIATDADLYGLSQISASDTFLGKTVYVISDIAANSGTVAEMKVADVDDKADNDPYDWTPIGISAAKPFEGTFDGQGHVISGIYLNNTTGSVGMFGYMKNSVDGDVAIQNFRLENSYFASSERMMGSIVVAGHGIIRNVYSSADIVSTYNGDLADYNHIGGIMGYTSSYNALFENCWFDGTITTSDGNVGGILGNGVTNTTYNHCSSTGVINCTKTKASYVGGFIGKIMDKMTATVRDSIYDGTINNSGCTARSFVGWNKNGIIGVYDSYTTSGENSADWVNGGSYAENSTAEYMTTANLSGYLALNTNLDFDNYWAVRATDVPALKMFADVKVCDIDTSWYDANEEILEISNEKELMGLSYLSQTNNFAKKTIKLVADIKLNTNAPSTKSGWDSYVQKNKVNEWIPIGTEEDPFAGIFDGQGYTISGLYINVGSLACQGLFTYINGATVCDFKLVNGYIKNSGATSGVIAGRSTNSTISDIYQNVYFENNSTSQGEWGSRVGGIIGQAEGTATTISNCWIAGDICATGAPVGGILGKLANGGTCNISNVICTSNITSTCTTAAYAGGVCGWRHNYGTLTISDSIFANTFNLASSSSAGTLVGLKHWNGQITSTNVYVLNNAATVAGASTKLPVGGSGGTSYLASGVTDLTGTNVTGLKAFDTLSLAYGTTWTVRKNKVPTLLQFANEDALLDTKWYNDTVTEFVIDTPAELYGLAYLSKIDNFAGKTVKLGADITVNKGTPSTLDAWNTYLTDSDLTPWMVIGSSETPFAGTFDGQGHTISGIYHNTTESYQGLFGVVNGATITNFRLENSYFATSGTFIASIAGQVQDSTITKLYSNAVVVQTATGSWSRSGGMFGQADAGTVTISECWFDGTFQTAGGRVGALLGWGSAVELYMSNCLNTGTLISSHSSTEEYTGGLIGGFNNNANTKGNISDCLNAGALALNDSTGVVGTAFGHLSYNASVTVNNVYATTNKAIVAGNETAIKVIYNAGVIDKGNGVIDYTGYDMNGVYGYSLTALNFETYWAVVADGTPILKQFAKETPSTAGIPRFDLTWYDSSKTAFTISKAEQLHALSYLVAMGIDTFGSNTITLDADIVMNAEAPNTQEEWATYVNANTIKWAPIGNGTVQFRGTFDGQGHEIRGLYAKTTAGKIGLFGDIRNATVKNFSVTNSYFETSENYVSGAIAYAQNSTISGIYSNAIVVSTDVDAYARAAGILAQGDTGTVTISECWFDGSVTSAGGRNGGIVGWAAAVTMNMSNCLNTGTVSSSYNSTNNEYTGGVLGGANNNANTTVSMSNILSAGTLQLTGTTSNTGTAFGFLGYNAKITVANVYATTSKAVIKGTETAHKINVGSPDSGSITDLTNVSIIGKDALTNACGLDYDGYWMAVEGKTPILKSFYAMAVDTAWYDNAADDATEYTISTANELYGLAKLSVTESFAGKTIYLANDISLNGKDSTKYQWVTPIGTESNPFAGTFDGQGNTISGIYINSLKGKQGLFGNLTGTIQNVRLEDGSITTSGSQSGTIAGTVTGTGNILNVYSNVDLVAKSASGYDHIGGFVGLATANADATLKIQNCWFDGSVTAAGRGVGGFVGTASGAKITLDIAHCLNTGDVSSSYGSSRTGGICGQVLNSTVAITDTLNAGHLSFSTNEHQVGSVVGVVDQGVTNGTGNVTLSSVFTTRESYVKPTSQSLDGESYKGISGVFYQVTENDRFVGYFSDYSNFAGTGNYAKDRKLDYANYWALSKTGTPVLKTFVATDSLYDVANVDTELVLTTWNNVEVTVTNAKDFGNGIYQITVNDETGYTDYVAALKDAGFTCIENTMDGMYSATCSKGEWIVTVIHAAGTVNKTYISFSTGQSISENLSASAADTTVKAEGAQNKLHMLQQAADGNSMVLELKNGNFVVYDGGMTGELETLMSYMKNLASTTNGEQNPVVIEAWIISHFHTDHCGALGYLRNYATNADMRGWLADVKVEAVYVNEPNDLVKDYEVLNQSIKTVTDVYNGIRFLQDTEGNVPNVYRMQAGQKYYFGDITMDVVFSQELATSIEMYTEDFGDVQSVDFNDTSTWIMFNVDGEKILLAADGNTQNMDYIMKVYSKDYLTVDVFQAPHHAANTYETFTNYCTIDDYVLFEGIYNPTSYTNWTGGSNEEGAKYYSHLVINENRKLVGLSPIITDTSTLVVQGYAGKLYEYDTTPTIPYFYMNGKHTILTFTGTGITGTQVEP